MFSKSQTAFGKKFPMGEPLARLYAAAFLRDPMGEPLAKLYAVAAPATMTGLAHTSNVVKLYQPLAEVRVHSPHPYSYTVVNVNPYTLEEQLVLYPFVVVDEYAPPE